MYVYQKVRARNFARAWGYIQVLNISWKNCFVIESHRNDIRKKPEIVGIFSKQGQSPKSHFHVFTVFYT